MTKKLWGKLDLDGKAQWQWSFYNPGRGRPFYCTVWRDKGRVRKLYQGGNRK